MAAHHGQKLICTPVSVILLCCIAACVACGQKQPLPESFGYYVVSGNTLKDLSQLKHLPVQQLPSIVSGWDRRFVLERGEADIDPGSHFIIYRQNASPGIPADGVLYRLYVSPETAERVAFQSTQSWTPREARHVQLLLLAFKHWDHESVEYKLQPVDGKPGMLRLIPVKALAPGVYGLDGVQYFFTVNFRGYADDVVRHITTSQSPSVSRTAEAIGLTLPKPEYSGQQAFLNASLDDKINTEVASPKDLMEAVYAWTIRSSHSAATMNDVDKARALGQKALQYKDDSDLRSRLQKLK